MLDPHRGAGLFDECVDLLARLTGEGGIHVESVRQIEPTLEDVFISLIGNSPTLARA